jgi:C4-dicarboxylate-specific signal transduction histidine kinase/CheY-like chemotaxis protein
MKFILVMLVHKFIDISGMNHQTPAHDKPPTAAQEVSLWKQRQQCLVARTFAARQREMAAAGRAEGAEVRADASAIRGEAARTRDDAARTRDDAARVRDAAAVMRDKAALARATANGLRQEALRHRLSRTEALNHEGWQELLDLDRTASKHSRDSAAHDREAASLDRTAAEKDREAADRDRTAADRDRTAADKDRLAAEKEAEAADSDRAAADSDRKESEKFLGLAETRLFQSERLAAMGRLTADLAHEINSPLSALITTLGKIQLEILKWDSRPDTLSSLMDNGLLAADRIHHIVCDVKGWLRDGKDDAVRQLIDVPKLIEDSISIARWRINSVAKLAVDLNPVPTLWGVQPRLSQVITNLLLNSVNSISGPKEENEIRISAKTEGKRIRIEVSDTGCGIDRGALPHVFDPFFTTREESGGTGLGLPMCRSIVEAHGGVLVVQDTSPAGTTIALLLPSGNVNAMAQSDPLDEKPKTANKERLLLIDDDPFICQMMALLLSDRLDVTIANDGRDGLAAILAPGAKWDLVLCDMMMPVMSGAEVYKSLMEHDPKKASEIVFMTAGGNNAEENEFLATLPNVVMRKPFSHTQLYELLDERLVAASSA